MVSVVIFPMTKSSGMSVSSSVILMVYFKMIPFLSSGSGGSQPNTSVREFVALATRRWGGA